ncbi:MAG: HIT family hydrolase [Candidatus Nanoarchaeia archaeon]|nr:HIT family hydrolase [Candidatus Nanoarchaeia archaeon]
MPKLESFEGIKSKVKCIGCDIQKCKIKTLKVYETKNFIVSQDFQTPIPGFMIVGSKKHIKGIENFSKKEREELIEVIYKTRVALNKVLGIKYIDLIQEEIGIERWTHFHIWMFPRYPWTKKFGESIDCIIPSMIYAQTKLKTKGNLEKVISSYEKIKNYFNKIK